MLVVGRWEVLLYVRLRECADGLRFEANFCRVAQKSVFRGFCKDSISINVLSFHAGLGFFCISWFLRGTAQFLRWDVD